MNPLLLAEKKRKENRMIFDKEKVLTVFTADIINRNNGKYHYRISTWYTYIEGTCDTSEEAKAKVQGLWEKLIMEALEPNVGCEYCLKGKEIVGAEEPIGKTKGRVVVTETSDLCLVLATQEDTIVGYGDINYCPMCGRELGEEV